MTDFDEPARTSHISKMVLSIVKFGGRGRNRTAIVSADVAHVANRPQTPAGESGERLAPLTGARTLWGARSPSIPAARVVRHHPAEKTPLRAAQRVGFRPDAQNRGGR